MISPKLSSLFCAIFLVAIFGGNHCQEAPGEVSSLQQMRADLRDEPHYLDQIFQFLSNVMGKLNNQSTHISGVLEKLTEIETWKAETEKHLKALSNSIRDIKWRTGLVDNSFEQKESPFILDATALPGGRGAIVFDGNKISARKRRFWVLENAGTVKFTLAANDLTPESRLTISGFKTVTYNYNHIAADFIDEVYINSSTAPGTELTVSGVVILITMTSNKTDNRTESDSRFALRFYRTQNDTVFPPDRVLYPSSFVTGEERQIVSFTKNNVVDYENNANQFTLISRPSGRDFNLTITFIDTEYGKDYFNVLGMEDGAETTHFTYKYGEWGRHFRKNWSSRRYSTAVVFFTSNPSVTGKGYEMMIE